MKIAVIGATGLIGQHTARAVLRHGYALRVIHRKGAELGRLQGLSFEAVEADLDDRASLERAFRDVDAVIHCAGYYPRQSCSFEEELAAAERQMENFCEAGIRSQCKKFIYVSAASTLRKAPERDIADESMRYAQQPPNSNPFQVIKWWMEQIADHYMARGLNMVIAIPSMVFGEYDYGPTAGRLITSIANGTLRRYIACNRNIIYGPDLAEGLIRCLTLGKASQRYILAGENVTMQDLVAKIAQRAGVPMPKKAPIALAHAIAKLQQIRFALGGKQPTVKTTELRMLAAGKFLDTSKARVELGFQATTSVEQAIERTLGWFREKGYVKCMEKQ